MNDMEWTGGETPEGQTAVVSAADLETVEASLRVTEDLFVSFMKDLDRHKKAVEAVCDGAIDPGQLKEALHTAKGVREAIGMLITERNRVDKLRKDIAGGVGGGALDLDAARDEVGRRLACLRRVGGG